MSRYKRDLHLKTQKISPAKADFLRFLKPVLKPGESYPMGKKST